MTEAPTDAPSLLSSARSGDTRERILHAARALVSSSGWHGAQVSAVAEQAGVAVGTVYRYFPSKAALLVDVLSTVSQREADVLRAIADAPGCARDKLQRAVVAFVERAMRNPKLAYALIAEPCEPAIDQARLTWRYAISMQILRILQAGLAQQVFRPELDAEIAATVIVGGFMEGLIGPLSPLKDRSDGAAAPSAQIVHAVAEQVARLCCAAVDICPEQRSPAPKTP